MGCKNILDLKYNIYALILAISRNDIYIPEQAFSILAGTEYRFTDEDIEDMIKLKNQGLTYKEIGEIYGLHKDNVYGKIRRYRHKMVS